MKEYAKLLTQEYLIKHGITQVDMDGTVYINNTKATFCKNNKGYLYVNVYKLDEKNKRIKVAKTVSYERKDGTTAYSKSYNYQMEAITLQRIMWAWFYGGVPAGYVVDHINNKHDEQSDYVINNLQLLTPAQNLAKDRKKSTYVPTMAKKKVYTEFYVNSKIAYYTDLYEYYKTRNLLETDKSIKKELADKTHKIRSALAQWKRRKEILFGQE